MSVPDDIRKQLRKQLSGVADELGWMSLSTTEKRKLYEDWTRDPKYGGTLARYIDKGQVRVYLKDTILKDYTRAAGADPSRPLRLLKIPADTPVAETYIKPHGRRLADGRVICWGGQATGNWSSWQCTSVHRTVRTPFLSRQSSPMPRVNLRNPLFGAWWKMPPPN